MHIFAWKVSIKLGHQNSLEICLMHRIHDGFNIDDGLNYIHQNVVYESLHLAFGNEMFEKYFVIHYQIVLIWILNISLLICYGPVSKTTPYAWIGAVS